MIDSPESDDEPGLGLDLPTMAPPKAAPASPYRVLARKYRPQTFAELIGQDAMVTTLGNAIAGGRIAHAFLLTGVRGVGKTSTARLVAKALNCIGPDGTGGPTIDPCGVCEPCVAIAEGRYIDVIEMDAASHTGVDDVREIIDESATPRLRRATKSISSMKSTCVPSLPSTRDSKLLRNHLSM